MTTEQRWFKIRGRKYGSIGQFEDHIMQLEVASTGSHHDMMYDAVKAATDAGWEVHHIISHSMQRNCL